MSFFSGADFLLYHCFLQTFFCQLKAQNCKFSFVFRFLLSYIRIMAGVIFVVNENSGALIPAASFSNDNKRFQGDPTSWNVLLSEFFF